MIDVQMRSAGVGQTEAVAHVIRYHENTTSNWVFSGVAGRMNGLFDTLNARFFGGRLPKAVISVGPDLILRYGTYRIGRDELGVQHRIHLNTRHFGRSQAAVAVTLLHEMAHAFQHLFGRPGHRPRYHNAEFVSMCAEIGFTCHRGSGVTLGVSQGLLATLTALGFSATQPLIQGADNSPIMRPVRKRVLRCGCGREVWALSDYGGGVLCRECGEAFSRPRGLRAA